MGIRALFEAFRDQALTFVQATGDEGPSFDLSSNALSALDSFPRVVMVPTTSTIADSVGQGAIGDLAMNPTSTALRRRSIKARTLRVQLWIWGKDFDNCEELMDHCAAAMQAQAWGSARAAGEDWTIGQQMASKAGQLVVLTYVVEMVLSREKETFATVTDFTPVTEEVDQPS